MYIEIISKFGQQKASRLLLVSRITSFEIYSAIIFISPLSLLSIITDTFVIAIYVSTFSVTLAEIF